MKRTHWLKMLVALALLIIIALVIVLPTGAHAAELPSTDPATPCKLTAEEYDRLLACTELEGIGWMLRAGEDITGVNGLFVTAIIAQETGWGTSRLAREENNLGGIAGSHGYRSFDSREECILYMFDLLDRLYIAQGRDTVEEISERYCVPPEHWAASIKSIMRTLIDKI